MAGAASIDGLAGSARQSLIRINSKSIAGAIAGLPLFTRSRPGLRQV